jgi:hypothetical protein
MFLPHRVAEDGSRIEPVTASAEAAALFAPRIPLTEGARRLDHWDRLFLEAERAASLPADDPACLLWKRRLIRMLFGQDDRIREIAEQYMDLGDLLAVQQREIGTGPIGGKAAGMLLARAILAADSAFDWNAHLERHDSFFVGSDVYYTYLVHNDCFRLRLRQNTEEAIFRSRMSCAADWNTGCSLRRCATGLSQCWSTLAILRSSCALPACSKTSSATPSPKVRKRILPGPGHSGDPLPSV